LSSSVIEFSSKRFISLLESSAASPSRFLYTLYTALPPVVINRG
jgi:hypothetical protein